MLRSSVFSSVCRLSIHRTGLLSAFGALAVAALLALPVSPARAQGAVCGFPDQIGVLSSQEAAQAQAGLARELSKDGFTQAGVGQRVLKQLYFKLPTVIDFANQPAIRPVGDYVIIEKILGFSTDCHVTQAFSRDAGKRQPVVEQYDLIVERADNADAPFEKLGEFAQGLAKLPRPGVYRLTVRAKGRLSPFRIGAVSQTVTVVSAGQNRTRGITQIRIDNPKGSKVVGTAFVIGSKRDPRDPDNRNHCKTYTFTSTVRVADITSETNSAVFSKNVREEPYSRATWELRRDGEVLEKIGPRGNFVFDARKYGDGNYQLFASIDEADLGGGPQNFRPAPARHIIQVLNCGGKKPAAQNLADGAGGLKVELPEDQLAEGGFENVGGAQQPGDLVPIPLHELDEDGNIVVRTQLEPERFLKEAAAPKVPPADQKACRDCEREIARRTKLLTQSCEPVTDLMEALLLDVLFHDAGQKDIEAIFLNDILTPLRDFRAPLQAQNTLMADYVERAARASVLQSKQAQTILAAGQRAALERDRKRRAAQGDDVLFIPMLLGADIPEPAIPFIFTSGAGQLAQVAKFKKELADISARASAEGSKTQTKVEAFIAKDLKEAREKIQERKDQLAQLRADNQSKKQRLAALFNAGTFEHCLGAPPGDSTSVLAGTEGEGLVTGLPGMNTTFPEHPDRDVSPEVFRKAAILPPPLKTVVEGFEDFFPLRFKMDGDKALAAQREITKQIKEVESLGGLVAIEDFFVGLRTFFETTGKASLNGLTLGAAFSDDPQLRAAKKFLTESLPRGFDIVVGTDIAAFIDEDLRVRQEDKLSGAVVLNQLGGFGIGNIAELTVNDAEAVGEAIGVALAQATRDEPTDLTEEATRFLVESEEQQTINKGQSAGVFLALDLLGGEALVVSARSLKVGGKVFTSTDEAIAAANDLRATKGLGPLDDVAEQAIRDTQKFADTVDEANELKRIEDQVDALAEQADNANVLDDLAKAADGDAPAGGSGSGRTVEDDLADIFGDAEQGTGNSDFLNDVADNAGGGRTVEDDLADIFGDGDGSADGGSFGLADDVADAGDATPDDVSDFFENLGKKPGTPEEKVADALDDVADEAEAAARAAKDKARQEALKQQAAAGNQGPPLTPGKVDKGAVELSPERAAALDDPAGAVGEGRTANVVAENIGDPNSDVIKLVENVRVDGTGKVVSKGEGGAGAKFDADAAREIVDDQINGAEKFADAGVNSLDIKGQGTVKRIIDGVEVEVPFFKQERFPEGAKTLEDIEKVAGEGNVKLTREQQIAILREFDKAANAKLVPFDTNPGNILVKGDGPNASAGFVESGSVIEAGSSESARAVVNERLFGSTNVGASEFNSFRKATAAGDDVLAKSIQDGTATKFGQGGAGGLKDLIDKDLRDAFADPDAFKDVLKKFDDARAPNVASGGQGGVAIDAVNEAAVLDAKAQRLRMLADDAADRVAGGNQSVDTQAQQAQKVSQDLKQAKTEQNQALAELVTKSKRLEDAKASGADADAIAALQNDVTTAGRNFSDRAQKTSDAFDAARKLVDSTPGTNADALARDLASVEAGLNAQGASAQGFGAVDTGGGN
ncbi:hypothetical protein [Pyruvatibacter sp.]|uniref:hypothetical protein n=1 Tax=Pyruvatibacter sp. TaxID=1981328 RepID=UPI0032658C8A